MGVTVWRVAQPLRVPAEKRLTLTHNQLVGIRGQGLALGVGRGAPPAPGPGGFPRTKDTLCSRVLNRTGLCGGHNLPESGPQ